MNYAVKLIQQFLLKCLCTVVINEEFSYAHVCDSPQLLEIATTGILKCSFEDGFDFVLWYNSTNKEREELLLHYRNSTKSGIGFTSGEFDIESDGSLIIRNVSLQHEHNFTAVYTHPRIPGITTIVVLVLVTVKPPVPYPVIGDYSETMRTVAFQVVNKPSLVCFVEKARPEISLNWMIRTGEGDKNITCTQNITRGELCYTTRVSTNEVFLYSSFVSLMVCKAISPPGMLRERESLVLVQNGNLDLERVSPIIKYVERGSRVELICADGETSFLVWRKVILSQQSDELLLYAVFLTKNVTRILIKEYEMGNMGTLVLPEVSVHHEGLYGCISGNGTDDKVSAYKVVVYANPVPPHTVVGGCDKAQNCILEADYEGYLTCTLNGIRPKVQLKFKTVYESDSSSILFMNQQMIDNNNGETFDLFLITKYRVRDKSSKRLAIECKVSGLNENMFNMTAAKVTLELRQDAEVESPQRTLLILLVSTNIIFLLIIICYFARRFFKKMSRRYRYEMSTQQTDNCQWTVASSANRQETTL